MRYKADGCVMLPSPSNSVLLRILSTYIARQSEADARDVGVLLTGICIRGQRASAAKRRLG